MEKYSLNSLREMFLEFFESKEHLRLKSFSLVPSGDKSLLLINSGMAPMKPYFLGEETPPSKRVANCQKCIRTPDIENVGKTSRHGTFFEMLGNFSFGDYFKKEAIAYAWEFMTKVVGISEEVLYVSVYEEDDEALKIWRDEIGLPKEKIVKLGKEDNFWEIGVGPCGPCSEIYVDRGVEYGCGKPDCTVGCDCDRYTEIWNLVFTQFNKDMEGNYSLLEHPNIDTGMGLERLSAYLQGVDTIFEVDTIKYILDYVCELSDVEYGKNERDDISIRVITDHIRSVVFMASDGVTTSNEGRGYVLKRLLRRALRHGKLLGMQGKFMANVAKKVIEISGDAYPELSEKQEVILKIVDIEEDRFNETIKQGMAILNELSDIAESKLSKIFDGEEAFKLYDTYGFPVELTEEILEEKGIALDREGFEAAMMQQREAARNARNKKDIVSYTSELTNILAGLPATKFEGYNQFTLEGKLLAIIKDGNEVNSAAKGDEVLLVFDKTPFYATSGGQVADTGKISNIDDKKLDIDINDCEKSGDKFLHAAIINDGTIEKGNEYKLSIYRQNRLNTMRNHSATHLLHKALKEVLGEHVNQAGSSVDPQKLRFDFSHFEKVTKEQLREVEKIVNAEILKAQDVVYFETDIDKARELGATALFGEKYGSIVRVVQMGDFSTELCGGCHVENTNDICMFKVVSESSVSAGVRRIEAVTGFEAINSSFEAFDAIEQATEKLKAKKDDMLYKLDNIIAENKELKKDIEKAKKDNRGDIVGEIASHKIKIGDKSVVFALVEDMGADELRDLSDKIKDNIKSGVVFLASAKNGKALMITTATKDIVSEGFNSGSFIREVAKSIGSGGGGRPDMAQAGIKDIERIHEALANAREFIKKELK